MHLNSYGGRDGDMWRRGLCIVYAGILREKAGLIGFAYVSSWNSVVWSWRKSGGERKRQCDSHMCVFAIHIWCLVH